MKPPGENGIWTPPRLRARLAALKGLAPAPSCYVIWRATTTGNAPEVSFYEAPGEGSGETVRLDEAAFEQWLADRKLAGAERLAVSVLVIREQLDDAGLVRANLVREGVLERRRGGHDGPYYGNVARIEFTGAAKMVRRYRVLRDGRLAELPDEDSTGAPPQQAEPDSFAGEDAAVDAHFGEGTVILDRRAPSLFEDLLGFTVIVHVRRRDGVEVGCGVGWHGPMAFVIAANFPRHGGNLIPPPDLEAVVEAAITSRDLVRHETRLDEQGFCVIARVRGQPALVTIRMDGITARVEPYVPGRIASANEDQRRWMTYAETYEARTILDSWRNGDGDEIAVLTIDPDQEAWLHVIDADGIEASRRPDNEAAAAILYRERVNPPEDPAMPDDSVAPAAPKAAIPRVEPEFEAPADSLLTAVLAWSRATALLSTVIAEGIPRGAVEQLNALIEPLTTLHANFSVGSLRRLIARTEADKMTAESFAAALDELVTRLRDELALIRIVTLPSIGVSTGFPLDGEPPFGPLVELHFPAATYDIEEAVRCLALRRATASVSHAMKVMRYGLRAVEHLLTTPSLVDLSWTRMIAAMRGAAGAHHALVEALTHVRRAWRAPGLLPADRYSEEEAEAVLAAVASFMRLLAAAQSEAGEMRAG
jgi:hypothetical protein